MSVPYTDFRWFYPPRTVSRIPYKPSPVLNMWKRFSDSIAQFKMNGTNDQVVVYPDQTIEHWPRHRFLAGTRKPDPNGEPAKMDYVLPPALRDQILSFTPKGKFTIYNAELLHDKTKMVKDVLYFFDVLVYDGQHLLGTPYKDRHAIIWEALKGEKMPIDVPTLSNALYVAHNIPNTEWDEAWKAAQPSPYVEGLVLKRQGASSRLQVALRERNNEAFLCRIRKPTKNFQH